jgi:hypothetical protein
MMKTILLLALSSMVIAGVLPSLPAKIILSAFVLLAALIHAACRAPIGCQDEGGFHSLTRYLEVASGRVSIRPATLLCRASEDALGTEEIFKIPT